MTKLHNCYQKVKENKLLAIALLAMAVLFGVVFSITPVFSRQGDTWKFYHVPLGIIIFLTVFVALALLTELSVSKKRMVKEIDDRKVFFGVFFSITIMGILYLLIFWPGTGIHDSVYIISSDNWGVAKQHPWFYCALIRLFVRFVFAIGGGYDIAIPLLSLVQIMITAGVYAYCVVWFKKKAAFEVGWFGIACVYIFYPIYSIYMVTLLKDIPYSLLLMLWVPFLYDMWESDGQILSKPSVYIQAVIYLTLSLLRNNGIYVSAFILVGMFVFFHKKWKQILSLCLILFLVMTGSSMFEKSRGITHLFKETVGIPLQQIAATVYYDGEITEEQEAFINQVMPIEFIKERYNPYTADRLKWGDSQLDNEFLNNHKGEFLRIWAELLIPNFKTYVVAYLKNTYSFWSLDNSLDNQKYTTFYVEAYDEWYADNEVKIKTILPEQLQSTMEAITTKAATCIGSGGIVWITIMMLFVLWYKKGVKILSIGLPLIGGWLTIMISTPLAYQWRYTLYFVMALPLIIGLTFINKKAE